MPQPKAKRSLLPERLLSRLWRDREWRRILFTRDGRRLRVLYPGRPNGGPGPDFRDAVVQVDDTPPVRGDVEVHRRAAGWNQHGHHRDPRFNGVVLHVVQQPSGEATTYRQDGRAVPVAELQARRAPRSGPVQNKHADAAFSYLRRWRALPLEGLGRLLEEAGERRFLNKSSLFRAALHREDAEELLYRGILEALGYNRNREPFLELALRLPWRNLRDAVRDIPLHSRRLTIRYLLTGMAGLSGNGTTATKRGASPGWGELSGHVTPMEPSVWCFAGVRPANQPHRRIAGAAALLADYVDTGLLAGILSIANDKSGTALRKALTVTGDGVTFIGPDRALDVAVNVVLPLLHAWGRFTEDPDLAGSCLRLYKRAPRLAENEVTREMTALLRVPTKIALVRGALRQQGLMHLYWLLLEERVASRLPVTRGVRERPGYYSPSFRAAGLNSWRVMNDQLEEQTVPMTFWYDLSDMKGKAA